MIEALGDLRPTDLTPPVFKKYAKDRGAANGTILREIGILRAALGWAQRHQLIEYRPEIGNPVKTPPPRERWLTKDEARALLAACTEPHVKLFITLGLQTAARSAAILEAKWSQVDFVARTIDYGRGHGNKRRAVVKLNGEVLEALKAAKQMAHSPYIVEFRGKPVQHIKNGFRTACEGAKLVGVTPHILRHSAATWAAIDGRPLQEIARMLGDSMVTVERVYAKWSPDYLEDTVASLQLGKPGRRKRLTGVRKHGTKRSKQGQRIKN